MLVINGNQYAIDEARLTEVKNELINTLQNKTITWNGASTLLTTALLETYQTASGKANIIMVDGAMPSTNLTKNSQYWVTTKGSTTLDNGRYIYIVDSLGAATYVGTSDTDLTQYVKKTDIVDNLTTTDTDKPLSANQGTKLLPLAGGTMTGPIISNRQGGSILYNATDDKQLLMGGGSSYTKGAYFTMNGKDVEGSDKGGQFKLFANNGTKTASFVGEPNGTLTWNTNQLISDSNGFQVKMVAMYDKTPSELFALCSDNSVRFFPCVNFTTATAPGGSAGATYSVIIHRTNSSYGSITAFLGNSTASVFRNGVLNGTMGTWTEMATNTVTSGTGTVNTTYANGTCAYYKQGRVVYAKINFTATKDIAASTTVITALPIPMADVCVTNWVSDGTYTMFVSSSTGYINTYEAIPSGKRMIATFTYISKS